jgi:hypothetical protein
MLSAKAACFHRLAASKCAACASAGWRCCAILLACRSGSA